MQVVQFPFGKDLKYQQESPQYPLSAGKKGKFYDLRVRDGSSCALRKVRDTCSCQTLEAALSDGVSAVMTEQGSCSRDGTVCYLILGSEGREGQLLSSALLLPNSLKTC